MGVTLNIQKITLKDEGFPDVLRHIPSPPKQLYAIGNLEPLKERPRLAVVGSRHVSPYGRSVTLRLAGELAAQGMVIVSGLALGVDALAHTAALQAGGQTIAVLPCGLDDICPRSNQNLARQIVEQGGALISEYEPGAPPITPYFVARNRLVSGLSSGVLITEAAEKSGSLHTANFALEQGRAVMAVPGNITSLTSVGTNNLIRTGATPVTKMEDVLETLGLTALDSSRPRPMGANAEEHRLLELLAQGVRESFELMHQSGLDPALFNQTLTMLEITGKIRPLGASQWTIR